jgi:hypothetical protein
MPGERRAYVVRDAGSPSRLGKLYKIYPHTLDSLLEALEDARFRSHTDRRRSSSSLVPAGMRRRVRETARPQIGRRGEAPVRSG